MMFATTKSIKAGSAAAAPQRRKLSLRLIRYELYSMLGNWYIPFFGLLFPLLMGQLIGRVILQNVPAAFVQEVVTSFCFSILQIVPLASIFLGHASIFSQELENKIPLRMQLFGIPFRLTLQAKLLAFTIFLSFALLFVMTINALSFNMALPTPGGFLIMILIFYSLSSILFLFAHGIANFLRRFAPTYGVSMSFYFFFMIIGGMMGIQYNDFPVAMQRVAKLFPFTYISSDMYKIWIGQPYNFAPMIQSFLFLAALSLATVVGSIYYRKQHAL